MPQLQLPLFPEGVTSITEDLAFRKENHQVVYLHGLLPVFQHDEKDLRSFRMFTSQLIVQGSATQGHIMKAFGVPLITIKRGTKLYREQGAAGFFKPKPRRDGTKLDALRLEESRALIEGGEALAVVSLRTGVLADTLRNAIAAGRLPSPKKKNHPKQTRKEQATLRHPSQR